MKKYFLIISIFTFLCAYADELTEEKKFNSHQFYYGLDIFDNFYHVRNSKCDLDGINTMDGFTLGYDYVKPDALYWGIEGLFAKNILRVKGSGIHNDKKNLEVYHFMANVEQRLGYTFGMQCNKTVFSPFLGVGYYYFDLELHSDKVHSDNWFYALGGFKCDHSFMSTLNVGLKAQAMYSFALDSCNEWGLEVSLPFTAFVEYFKRFDVQVEPYYMWFDTRSERQLFGFRFIVGCNF